MSLDNIDKMSCYEEEEFVVEDDSSSSSCGSSRSSFKRRKNLKLRAQLWLCEKAVLFQMITLLSTEPLMLKLTGAKKQETKGYLEDW